MPQLLARYSPLTASLVLGALWGLWHLPLFWVAGTAQAAMPLLPFLAGLLANTVLYTWVFRHTNGSVLAAILLHVALNATPVYVPADLSSPWAAGVSVLAVLAVLLVEGRVWLIHPKEGVPPQRAAL